MWSSPKNAGSQQKLKEVKNLHAKQETLVLFLALEDQLEEGKATHSFPCDSAGKESACNAGDLSPIPGLGRSPGEGNLEYSCLENPMDRGAWQATVHGVTESDSTG